MKKFIFMLFAAVNISAQAPPANQVLVRDITQEVQYRPMSTPLWTPLVSGMRLGERSFIRLNTPESVVTLSLPDGSLLRLIGIGVIYIDSIVRTVNNINQSKILLLTGRWFYSANSLQPTRFIVNTDVTTSIVENGSGGGYFYQGTNEMILRSGRGLFGYRQQDSFPLAMEPNQVLTFSVLDGFFRVPELATAEKYKEYIIITPQDAKEVDPFLLSMGKLKYSPQTFVARKKEALTEDQINFQGLKSLENLKFVRKVDALAIGMTKTITNKPPPVANIEPTVPKAIPLALLKPLNISDFEVPTVPVEKTNQNVLIKRSEPKAPEAPVITARKRKKVEAQLAPLEEVLETADIPEEVIDLAEATANIKVAAKPPSPAKSASAASPVRSKAPVAAAQKRKNTGGQSDLLEETVDLEEVAADKAVAKRSSPTKAAKIAPSSSGNNPLSSPSSAPEVFDPLYMAPDGYNRGYYADDPAFQYKRFEVNGLDDLMQGNFSRSMFY